jgi:hypothetical protein
MVCPVNITALIAIASKLDASGFAARFPDPMLVVRKKLEIADANAPTDLDWRQSTRQGGFQTSAFKLNQFNTARNEPGERKHVSPTAGLQDASVEPLTKSRRNPFEGMITVGRAPNNDVCLHVSSVSKLHAYFRKDAGRWTLTDKGSANGTFVNGVRIKNEEAAPVEDGAYLLFGPDADCVFKLPLSLHAFVIEISKLGKK